MSCKKCIFEIVIDTVIAIFIICTILNVHYGARFLLRVFLWVLYIFFKVE